MANINTNSLTYMVKHWLNTCLLLHIINSFCVKFLYKVEQGSHGMSTENVNIHNVLGAIHGFMKQSSESTVGRASGVWY